MVSEAVSTRKTLAGSLARRAGRLLIVIIVGTYIAMVLFALFLANGVMFQPHPASYRDDASIVKLKSRDGARISATYLKNEAATYTILFSHGNAEDIGDMRPFYEELRSAGFSIFAYDYQGYGTSEGKATELHVYEDAEAAYEYLTGTMKLPPERVISMGRSLGAAVAIDLASKKKVAGVVAQSSFATAFRVLTRVPLLPWDKFRNIDKIGKVNCPVLVMHGRADEVVPFSQGEKVFAAAKEPKRAYWVEHGDHNNLQMFAGDRYFVELREFAKGLEKGPAAGH